MLLRYRYEGAPDPESVDQKKLKMESVDPILGFSIFTHTMEWIARSKIGRSKIGSPEKSQDGNSRPHTWFLPIYTYN